MGCYTSRAQVQLERNLNVQNFHTARTLRQITLVTARVTVNFSVITMIIASAMTTESVAVKAK
jgi:hypothetical protein